MKVVSMSEYKTSARQTAENTPLPMRRLSAIALHAEALLDLSPREIAIGLGEESALVQLDEAIEALQQIRRAVARRRAR